MSYLVPTVIEQSPRGERAYDIYSRLLKDRIVMLTTEINDDSASLLTAQLLHLRPRTPTRTSPCTSTARGVGHLHLRHLRHHAVHPARRLHCVPGHGRLRWRRAPGRGRRRQAVHAAQLPDLDPPTPRRCPGPVDRHREPGAGDRFPPRAGSSRSWPITPASPSTASSPTPTGTTSWAPPRRSSTAWSTRCSSTANCVLHRRRRLERPPPAEPTAEGTGPAERTTLAPDVNPDKPPPAYRAGVARRRTPRTGTSS